MFKEMTRTEAISTYVQMGEEGEHTEEELQSVYRQLLEQFGYDGVEAELEHY